jgi:hypothetical protein
MEPLHYINSPQKEGHLSLSVHSLNKKTAKNYNVLSPLKPSLYQILSVELLLFSQGIAHGREALNVSMPEAGLFLLL